MKQQIFIACNFNATLYNNESMGVLSFR